MELSWKDFAKVLAVIFLFSGCGGFAAYAMGSNETDRLALLEFKAKITDDPLRVLKSWKPSTSVNGMVLDAAEGIRESSRWTCIPINWWDLYHHTLEI